MLLPPARELVRITISGACSAAARRLSRMAASSTTYGV